MCGVLGGFSGASNTHSFTKSIYRCFEILHCTNVGPTSSYPKKNFLKNLIMRKMWETIDLHAVEVLTTLVKCSGGSLD